MVRGQDNDNIFSLSTLVLGCPNGGGEGAFPEVKASYI